ncbi:MAG: tRNA 2-thiocytidine biosynthesis TtcA family protein [Bacteroidaceae bacterium]|jgi:tRNA(Ile)-lysidine synthase TilS/MesJ
MRPDSRQLLERNLFRLLNKGLKNYHLIDDGDKILIGLSGGKDSLCLTELLARRSRVRRPQFSVEALHIKMENVPYESDLSYLHHFCQNLNVPLHIVTTHFDTDTQSTRSACFLCSWTRRKSLFNFAQSNGFNKIALGHNNDDILQTLLMNQIFEGSFSPMPVLLKYRKMPITLIRPMCRIPEQFLKQWAEMNHYLKQQRRCPYEQESNRTRVKHLLEELESINPEVRYSLWHALEKEHKLIEF